MKKRQLKEIIRRQSAELAKMRVETWARSAFTVGAPCEKCNALKREIEHNNAQIKAFVRSCENWTRERSELEKEAGEYQELYVNAQAQVVRLTEVNAELAQELKRLRELASMSSF